MKSKAYLYIIILLIFTGCSSKNNQAFKFEKRIDGSRVQILDGDNKKRVLDINGSYNHQFACGVGATYHHFSVEDDKKYFKIYDEISEDPVELTENGKKQLVASVPKESEKDKLLFSNFERTIVAGSNYYIFNKKTDISPYEIFYQHNKKYAFMGTIDVSFDAKSDRWMYDLNISKNMVFYDSISKVSSVGFKFNKFLVEKDGLLGYLHLTEIKYSMLNPFDNFLARFELPNGEKGYIDRDGNEYFD